MSQKQYAYFSAAIRDGAKLRPQAFGCLSNGGASCALGAGYEAMTGQIEGAAYGIVELKFPYIETPCHVCPVPSCEDIPDPEEDNDMGDMVVHLNDEHKWTREAIADWLYAEEEKLGFVTIDTEALKPQVGFHPETVNATA